ncbi:alpha/beta fold hydrolase [Pseudoxanthomonas indica]|uniref:Pimeloyl-ACP methyl ester carboxylesterase n=1 Tax=Pseudoxanthomonas indica TaxID=428993 RepID=A0A1T5LA80_9GAMM|nr:alpha/beta hydrolase [Pseudoxanthomonas indica]GGD32705.1 lipase [Pseudoxanthomonas indica]SKC72956.1 Pimeloyl-ACP methyl ester carboxylesterase [Pseudoxanthomonas indica]
MAVRLTGVKTVAVLAAVFVCALGLWLWRDPMGLINAEFARQRWMAGLEAHDITVAGHRIAYVERQAREPGAATVVMVHGFTGSKENWYPVAARLIGHYRVIALDLPGWGQSQRLPGQDYGFDAQNRRLQAFLQAIRQPGSPIVLVGHSMGGGIVALTSADQPALVARVGLIDAAGVRFHDNVFGEAVLAGKNPFAVSDPASLQRYLDTVFFDRGKQPWIPWPARNALIDFRRRQAPFEQAVLDRIGRSQERFLPGEAAAHIDQPALLLWCDQDRVIDPSALDLYGARMPQALKVRLSRCGHMSIMERPDDVAAAIDTLIRRGVAR